MNITGALVLFFVFIFVYIFIVEVFTVLFRLTGLTSDRARFQVISMLTNSGFTTSDSEIITQSKKRRKLAKATMIFGYSFTVIIVSCVVNVFITLKDNEIKNLFGTSLVIIAGSILLLSIKRLKFIKSAVDRLIGIVGNKVMFGEDSNPIVLIDTYGSFAMAEVKLKQIPQRLEHVKLQDSRLKEYYKIQIILIKRNKETLSHVKGDAVLQKNDTIVVFGEYKNVRALFEKPYENNYHDQIPN